MLLEQIKLEKDEVILKTLRKHWFVIGAELMGIFLILLLPFFVIFILSISPTLTEKLPFDLFDYTTTIVFVLSTWALVCLIAGFTAWTHYYLDLWIITDRRVVAVNQIHFFSRNVSMFRLERLQDIEYYIQGFIPTLLNFGTLKAQTAGSHEHNFCFSGLPNPRELQSMIQQAVDARWNSMQSQTD